TLDLRLHLDPTNSSSYSGSGTNVADLSGFNNNGTVAAAGPTWDADFTRFTYDGACTGSSGNYVCDEIEIEDSTSLRPGEPYEDLAIELNQGSTTNQHLKAPSTSEGYTLGAISTSFTISAWVKPTDCEGNSGTPTFVNKKHSYMIGCDEGTWWYSLGGGSSWYGSGSGWTNTNVPAEDDVWQHIALTRSSSSTGVKLFLNGVQSYSVSSYEGNLGNNNAQPLHVGTRQDYATTDAWHGLIDDLRIYTSDRSSTIAGDMNGYPNVTDAALNAFFDFNLERHGDVETSVPNMASGSGSSAARIWHTGSPQVVRTWDVSTVGSDTVLTFERTVLTAQGGWRVPTGVSSADVLIV
ncbi:MAG: LamG domain-containing protein, partial [Candidatus Poseidoniaceae archaeon]